MSELLHGESKELLPPNLVRISYFWSLEGSRETRFYITLRETVFKSKNTAVGITHRHPKDKPHFMTGIRESARKILHDVEEIQGLFLGLEEGGRYAYFLNRHLGGNPNKVDWNRIRRHINHQVRMTIYEREKEVNQQIEGYREASIALLNLIQKQIEN